MAKIRVENNFLWVVLAAIKIYSMNFLKFCGYMTFPILGQVLGLLLTLCLAGIYTVYLPELALKYPIFKDNLTIVLCVVIITIPGMLVYIKAFWDYLVAYGAMNSVTEGYLETGKIYDFPAHNATVTKQAGKYIALWFLYSIFLFLAINPFLWVIGGILFVYFILIFQIFSYEPEQSPKGCFKRSFEMIRGNAFRTLLIMFIIGIFTHVLFVQGFSVFFDFTRLSGILGAFFEEYVVSYLPLNVLNENILQINPTFDILTSAKVSSFLVYQIVAFLVIGYTLPLRSITWALWYHAILTKNEQIERRNGKNKKKALKKLSQDVIDRAMRKYKD